ncbi:MAG TPA: HmuY family protein [Polyangiaceae bacterium]|nr:HmuY family protein [Polyangiaceae bacterium]
MRPAIFCVLVGLCSTSIACGNTAGKRGKVVATAPTDAGADAKVFAGTDVLEVPVPASGRVYVSLSALSVIVPNGDPQASPEWDLAFEGYDIYTNSGASGSGMGGAFGPLDPALFLGAAAPSVPFISVDKAGGAFLDWYAYDGSTHVLYSRFHVYGVQDGKRLWKVQVLGYYGTQANAATSALYQLRYAELTSEVGDTKTLQVDGTAGGLSAPTTAPSGCLDLETGTVTPLTVTEAKASSAWDLCFRRDAISVNGEAGGPGMVGAIDLDASGTSAEQLQDVEKKTADAEQAQFDSVTAESFSKAVFRGDHVVSAFETGGWLDSTQSPPVPTGQAWLVVDASGQQKFLVAFSSFKNATTSSPGTVVVHIKPVSG